MARAAASTATRERSTGSAKLNVNGTAAAQMIEPPGDTVTALNQERVESSSKASTSGSLVASDVRRGKVIHDAMQSQHLP